ncbi:GNAT family N-acetyltransferase [Pseudoxanthomonas sp. PXM02]|uniref:GNAT family N-acetyltransferase n=1 Tax=Pseudoxanthomonas sp. PXM02 TaxID=2769294 RepID=UPI00178358C8|nr:GNAT family N-acetyltransferase [Pseudoxanthomonas sp. PXM02]MBD9478803.1 GNAT family N-acetyltransferase [Pseudoxanthomonas sp. PXM02]
MPSPTLRPYRSDDAPLLTDLYARSVLHYGPRAYSEEQVAAWAALATVERTAARCADGRHVLVAQDAAGGVLGFGDLEADGHLDFLYVAPEAEGQHVGSLLYAALEDHARGLGLSRIFVEASELARPLFERRGFLILGRNDLDLAGVAIHNYRMEKWW